MKRLSGFKDITVFAVHDSLLVESDHLDMLYEVVVDESQNYFGFEPKFNVKDVSTHQLRSQEILQIGNRSNGRGLGLFA
ncbi:hypothetical protein BH10PSE19_BH10PSE19_19360 [soil metagenome]